MNPEDVQEHDDPTPDTWKERAQGLRRRALPYLMVLGVGLVIGLVMSSGSAPDTLPDQATDPAKATSPEVWTCSMHPQIQSPDPGACPICGMDLIPASSGSEEVLADHALRLSPRAQALARLQTAEVVPTAYQGSSSDLLGRISSDESTQKFVTAWIGGRIDRLYVSTTGEEVKRGQAMARLYSPQVYAAHQDLLVALAQRERLSQAGGFAQETASAQVESARQRLRLLGLSASDLEKMERAEAPWTQVTIRSTASGTVTSQRVRSGQYIEQGAVLFEVADLDNVWVELDAYESDLRLLTEGQSVELEFDALPDETIMGKVAFIEPFVNARTRVATVRVEVPNADGRLKPGMYARATIEPGIAQASSTLSLVIPRSAPLYAGERALVYVEKQSDQEGAIYEAREVILGDVVRDQVVVRAGLSRGERVVTHGAFVLDSDLQIRGKLSLMARADDTQRSAHEALIALDAPQRQKLAVVMQGYLDLQERLAADDLKGGLERAQRWRTQLEAVELQGAVASAWRPFITLFGADLAPLIEAETLGDARAQFSHITQTMDRFLAQFGNTSDQVVRRAYCPMAQNDKGDHWYQRGETVDNVYFGEQMRRCGEIRRALEPGAHLMPESQPAASQGGAHAH